MEFHHCDNNRDDKVMVFEIVMHLIYKLDGCSGCRALTEREVMLQFSAVEESK